MHRPPPLSRTAPRHGRTPHRTARDPRPLPARGVTALATDRFNAAVTAMIGRLSHFLPPPGAPPRPSTLTVLQAAERPVGVGNWQGNVERGPVAVLGVKGGRVEARVRYDLRADTPHEAAAAVQQLQQAVRAARLDPLLPWIHDFLVLEPDGGAPADPLGPDEGWRQSVEYRVLYEYRYEDAEDAGGLLVRIPVDLRGEHHEDDAVTRDVVRWSVDEAPPLRLRGPRVVGTLTALAFRGAAWPAGPVTLAVTGAAPGPPASHGNDLDAFALAVVSGGRNEEVTFADVAALVAAFTSAGGDVTLADGNGDPAAYRALALRGPPVVPPAPPPPVARLAGVRLAAGEVLEVRYRNLALSPGDPQHFPPATESVVYLGTARGPFA